MFYYLIEKYKKKNYILIKRVPHCNQTPRQMLRQQQQTHQQ